MNGITLACPAARRILHASIILFTCILFSACGGGSSGSSDSNTLPPVAENGEVIIGLTDAEGDFHSYTVDVLSLKLTHQNGTEVETLPLSTRVDFAQYTELTEFLTAATVPNGIYTSASLLVDYSNAEIIVEDEFGNGVDGIALDSSGDPLGQLALRVEFENTDTLRIAPGIPAHITLDFDLAASNSVDLVPVPAEVTVEPILIADTLLEDPKPHRLRGLLNQVAVDENVFSIHIRPFYRHNGNFGSIRVHSNDDTRYEIDGQDYSGHAGIEALDLLATRSPIVVLGQLQPDSRQFVASDVLAGSSVPWGDKDIVQGNVLARNGDEITLSRVVRRRHDNEIRHQQLITVLLSANTVVKKQGDSNPIDISAVSVGQKLSVIGEFTDDLTLDASAGRVRLLYTHLNGNAVTDLPLVLDLQSIDHRRVSLYDFNGTGTSENADSDNYEVDTSTLTLSAINIDEPLKVIGHVRPFGAAPADFDAQTVIALKDAPAKMLVSWVDGGTTAPFLSQSETGLVLNLDPAIVGELHTVKRNGVATNLLELDSNPSLIPSENGSGVFIIAFKGRNRLYLSFANFSSALTNLLDGSNTLQGLSAHGHFDDDDVIFTARKIVVRVD